ncbi:hypothetical protein Nepgr_005617 [Nepenthes gracilis]|uniref:Uncharacterized protein n=1 Tax=Nepenthes gracilis TaxID=150966 RepID=A0AAD3XGM4_NEPGR|nr:hypothetical protein Nepgr_005617 [Nepenthes gracilis]
MYRQQVDDEDDGWMTTSRSGRCGTRPPETRRLLSVTSATCDRHPRKSSLLKYSFKVSRSIGSIALP